MNKLLNKKEKVIFLIAAGICVIILGVLNIAITFMGKARLKQSGTQDTASSFQQESTSVNQNFQARGTFADIHIDGSANGMVQPEQVSVQNENEFLCPKAITSVLSEEDIENLKNTVYENLPQDKDIIQMVINEIYARNGYRFENQELQTYFEAKNWYVPSTDSEADMDSIYAGMSEIDKANIDLLKDER